MPASFPPQDLDCPDPAGCPVASTLPRLRNTCCGRAPSGIAPTTPPWGYDEHNPSYGDFRISPIEDPVAGDRLPSMGKPPAHLGASHWSARLMGKRLGIWFASVARIWRKWNPAAPGRDIQVLHRPAAGSQAARRSGSTWTHLLTTTAPITL